VAPVAVIHYRDIALGPSKVSGVFAFDYLMEGEGGFLFGDAWRPLRPNDIFVFRPGNQSLFKSEGLWRVMGISYDAEHAASPFPGEPCWQTRDPAAARALVERLAHYAARATEPGNADLVDLLAAALMAECARKGTEPKGRDPLRRVMEHLEANFQRDIPPTELVRLSGLSRSHFFRLWKEGNALPPGEYQHHVRTRRALELLQDTALRIKEIAAAVGYDDPYYFTYKFKRLVGMSPKAYRESL